MNVFCLGGKVIGSALALELIKVFLTARFSNAERHRRRLSKVQALETVWSRTEERSVDAAQLIGPSK
jgi:ribose 5-phosphate isomerase B